MFIVVYYTPKGDKIKLVIVNTTVGEEIPGILLSHAPDFKDIDQLVSLRPADPESTVYIGERPTGHYTIVVGNTGTVYDGHDIKEAMKAYHSYAMQSREGKGKAAGEIVAMFENGVPMQEWRPHTKH